MNAFRGNKKKYYFHMAFFSRLSIENCVKRVPEKMKSVFDVEWKSIWVYKDAFNSDYLGH